MESMMTIIKKLAMSYEYHRLETLIVLFEEKVFVPSIKRKIIAAFVVLKMKILKIIKKMSRSGLSSAKIMYFYRLIRKFLPAFPRFYSLNI